MVLATFMLNENIIMTAMVPCIKRVLLEDVYRLMSVLSYREIAHIARTSKLCQ